MANQTRDASFRSVIDRFTRELTAVISRQVEEQVSAALSRIQVGGGARVHLDGRRSGRLCPVPGCGEPGAGPRNRWFCKDHAGKLSAAEQKSILERNRRLAAEGKLPTAIPAQRIVRLPAKSPRPRRALDMSCRVEGCLNRSRGPRALERPAEGRRGGGRAGAGQGAAGAGPAHRPQGGIRGSVTTRARAA